MKSTMRRHEWRRGTQEWVRHTCKGWRTL